MTTEGATNGGRGGVILTTPRAKKPPSANLTSRAYPSDVLKRSVMLSFDRQVPAFQRWVFPRYFPASDPISLGWSVLSIYLNVAEILPMGGVAGRLRKEKSPMGKSIKRRLGFNPSPLVGSERLLVWTWTGSTGEGHVGDSVLLIPTLSANLIRS